MGGASLKVFSYTLAEDEKDRQRHGVTEAIFIPLAID